MRLPILFTALCASLLAPSLRASEDTDILSPETAHALIDSLKPLHTPMGTPKKGDWLDRFKEPGQTFDQYLACKAVAPDDIRKILYIQPIGAFSDSQLEQLELTSEFLGLFFNMPVVTLPAIPATDIPQKARRINEHTQQEQFLSTYILSGILKPRLPNDAFACIAFTATDLWPGKNWNFVFGQASLSERVGVWSINRYGTYDSNNPATLEALRRTLKVAAHETGHMLTIKHCTAYNCLMNGSNSLKESDEKPLWPCPECEAKICRATRIKPDDHFFDLASFCEKNGLVAEAEFFTRSRAAIKAAPVESK